MPIILLALLIAIYYILAHQWYKQIGLSIDRLRSAGLPTTPAEYIGEPVPDEENSAPIFKEIDQYIAEDTERYCNEQLVLEMFDSHVHRAEVWDGAKELVSRRSSLFTLIEKAVERPYCWIPCEPTAKGLLSRYDILPEASRHSSRLFVMRSILRAADGDVDGAVSDVICSFGIGSVMSQMRCMFGFMAREAMICTSLKAMVELFEYGKLEERHIRRLFDEISAINLNAEYAEAVKGEAAYATSKYHHGKKLIFMPLVMFETTAAISALERQLAGLGMNYSEATARLISEPAGKLAPFTPDGWRTGPFFTHINLQKYITLSNIACFEAFLAVNMYHLKHQRLPARLDEATTDLGLELSQNPFTESDPIYTLTDQGFELRCPCREGVKDAVIKANRNQFGKYNYELQMGSIVIQP